MGKLFSWVVIGLLGYLAYRLMIVLQRKALAARAAGQGAPAPGGAPASSQSGNAPRELMLRCDVCGTHVPTSEAFNARGHHYCSAAHRDQAA